jgi:hypothetical protein
MKIPEVILIFAVVSVSAFAQQSAEDYLSFLPTAERAKLFRQGELHNIGDKPADLLIWKNSPFAVDVNALAQGLDVSVAAESLFLIDRPPASDDKKLGLKIFKSFTAFTTMKGLQVFSESLRKMETFIYDSYRVASLHDTRPLPDPVVDTVPAEARYVVYEKEEQTGDMYNYFSFRTKGGWYQVDLINLSNINFAVFTLVGRKKMHTSFFIVPTRDKIIVYAITMADTMRFLGIEKLKQKSFFNRMTALGSWFSANLARTR